MGMIPEILSLLEQQTALALEISTLKISIAEMRVEALLEKHLQGAHQKPKDFGPKTSTMRGLRTEFQAKQAKFNTNVAAVAILMESLKQ